MPANHEASTGGAIRITRPRPRPAVTRDNRFFWDGVQAGKLLIQRCDCERLRHPPGPICPSCHSLEWTTTLANGDGRIYSFVVAHHPPIPPFDYPNVIVFEGHTDSAFAATSRHATPWDLAGARAASVATLFQREGFPTKQIGLRSYGDSRPEVPNETVMSRARNRRVDILILAPGEE